MWMRFYLKPFEAFVGVFVIVNGILTLFPGSVVGTNLWNLLGSVGIVIPVLQIIAGAMKITGIALNRSNIEASGLIIVSCLFAVRAITLCLDGDITLADINNVTIAVGIIVSNFVRLTQVLNGHKYIVAEIKATAEVEEK